MRVSATKEADKGHASMSLETCPSGAWGAQGTSTGIDVNRWLEADRVCVWEWEREREIVKWTKLMPIWW